MAFRQSWLIFWFLQNQRVRVPDMAKHISVRLQWHDRGWDGHVCNRPTANVYCTAEYGVKAHNIRENKKDHEEEVIAGKVCSSIPKGGYLPPCLRTIQTFGGTKPLPWLHTPKDFLSTKDSVVSPIPETIPPFTAGTWGYDQVFRRNAPTEEVPEAFEDRYSPAEAKQNIERLFGQGPGQDPVPRRSGDGGPVAGAGFPVYHSSGRGKQAERDPTEQAIQATIRELRSKVLFLLWHPRRTSPTL